MIVYDIKENNFMVDKQEYILTFLFFLSVWTYFLSAHAFMNIKTSKRIDILLVEKHDSNEKFSNQIMNTKCFINGNSYHCNNIYSKNHKC